jgi:hypothetical protein
MILKNVFFVNILLLACDESQGVANPNYFMVLKNQNLNMSLSESSLISSVYKPSRMQCMTACSANTNCKTAVYDNSQRMLINCFLYSRFFKISEMIPSSTKVVYEKKPGKIFLHPNQFIS